ncbi:tetratricopeptide repeat protein [Solitalea koreensis]|uniref:TPR repeat-containing protein n=1 Tax=Solitalea koreensis TaxID=543615 RepID=A0A521BF78_9SPHI|nr:tetratricopeptide repeat protein [Solitalea koreensis]SMO45360.1 TPR repeat-containing protein [Solitalea koreensis]
MKKILLSGLLLAAVTVAKAQNAEVENAEKMVMLKQLDKAKESIDKAVVHPKTTTLPHTYMVKVQVYTAIANDTSRHNLDYDPIQIASESLKKAKELDVKKSISEEDLKNASFNLYAAGYNKGLGAYNKEDFKTALKYFKFASEMNPSDTSLYLNTGIVAEKINDKESEEAAFTKLADMNYDKEPYIYKALYDIKKNKGDKEGAKAILEKGRSIFPTDNYLMIEELNMYLAEGKSDVIVDKLNKAIAADPSNKTLQFTLGVTYENLKKPDEAAAAYKKALEIDPNYFDANYNLGALYFNQAADIIKKANMLPTNKVKEYDVEKQKFLKKAGEATPYLEKAYAINPKDRNVLISLKEIYSRTGAKDKYAKIDAELKALGE